jgi:hypothetical protein
MLKAVPARQASYINIQFVQYRQILENKTEEGIFL